MKGRARRAVAVLAVLSACLLGAAGGGPEPGPRRVVENLHAGLIAVMQEADALGYPGRYRQLDGLIRETFDLPLIARIAVGRHWRDLTEAQRSELVETFTRLSVATYAARFDGYAGERFETLGEEDLGRGQRLVRSALVKPSGERVSFDYVLRPTDGRWKVINVSVDGVSDLSLKRAEYTSILEKDGFDALIAALREKIAAYAAGGEP